MDPAVYDECFELEEHHWWFVARRALLLRMIRSSFAAPPRSILDIGCGTGVNLEELEKLGPVVGLDPAAEALAYCAKRRDFTLVSGFMSKLPFAAASFDLVTAFDVLEHDADPEACLGEVFRVLRPGGLFFLSVPAYGYMWGAHDVAAHHYRRYRRPQLRRDLAGAGFEIVRATYLNTLLFPIAVVFRQGKNLIGRFTRPEPRTDFGKTGPPGLNQLLRLVFAAEGPLLDRFDLPFGLSIACAAQRPLGSSPSAS